MLKRSSFVAKRSGFVYIKNANRFRQSVQNNWLARCSFSSIRVWRWSLHVLVFCNTQLYFLLFEKWHQQLDASTSCKVCKDMTSIYSLEQSLKSPWTWLSTCTFQNILEYSWLTHYFAQTFTFCLHSHTMTRKRLNNNFQSLKIYYCWFIPNWSGEIMGFLVDRWYTCKHFFIFSHF